MANQPVTLDEAKVLKELNEAEFLSQLRRKTELEANVLEDIKRKEDASLDTHRIYPFNGAVSSASASACISYLGQWAREDPEKPITVVFNSPGGAVHPGLALYDFILDLRRNGTRVDTESIGYAASMGGILLQAGEKRSLGANAYLLIHEVSDVAAGNMSEIEDQVKFTKRVQNRLLDILAERSALTQRQIKRRWKKTDWWLGAEEALELGFIDEISAGKA